eukprot:Clim_evm6s88 gene=Clim_evmTU6s88
MSLVLGIIGPGLVGGELIEQLFTRIPVLREQINASIVVGGVCNSKKMAVWPAASSTSNLPNWKELLAGGDDVNMDKFVESLVREANVPTRVALVDCTSNEFIASKYVDWMSQGINVVTPNKKAFSSDLGVFQTLYKLQADNKVFVFHEATVGAGLPIIEPLKVLMRTGDKITQIEGIFSGTLAYLFNTFSPKTGPIATPFSEVVKGAKAAGYTEPDPRDDLNGMDVARKVTILSRVSGINDSLDSLPVQNIVPKELQGVPTADEFLEKLPEFDAYFTDLNAKAFANGKVLRYVGVVKPNGGSSVELREYDISHPFANMTGSDNVVSFTTERYPNPLIIQGAGAGAAVTAMGVFGDIITLANCVC